VRKEELHNLYFRQIIIRMMKSRRIRWAGHVTRMSEKRNACRLFVGKPEGKRRLGGRIILKVDLGEIGWGGMDCIRLVEDRDQWWAVVNTVMNLRVP
jgi:hypothetical protein